METLTLKNNAGIPAAHEVQQIDVGNNNNIAIGYHAQVGNHAIAIGANALAFGNPVGYQHANNDLYGEDDLYGDDDWVQ